MTDERKIVGTIDITPTWEAVLPIYMDALEYGQGPGVFAAREELRRMAKLADLYVASQKKDATE